MKAWLWESIYWMLTICVSCIVPLDATIKYDMNDVISRCDNATTSSEDSSSVHFIPQSEEIINTNVSPHRHHRLLVHRESALRHFPERNPLTYFGSGSAPAANRRPFNYMVRIPTKQESTYLNDEEGVVQGRTSPLITLLLIPPAILELQAIGALVILAPFIAAGLFLAFVLL